MQLFLSNHQHIKKEVQKQCIEVKNEFIIMSFLPIFINGLILDNALILRLAFLIVPSKCSLKLSLLSTVIHNSFPQLLFLRTNMPRYILIFTNNQMTFILVYLHLVICKQSETVSSLLITSSIVSAETQGVCTTSKISVTHHVK